MMLQEVHALDGRHLRRQHPHHIAVPSDDILGAGEIVQVWWEVQGDSAFQARDRPPPPCVSEEQGVEIWVGFVGAQP